MKKQEHLPETSGRFINNGSFNQFWALLPSSFFLQFRRFTQIFPFKENLIVVRLTFEIWFVISWNIYSLYFTLTRRKDIICWWLVVHVYDSSWKSGEREFRAGWWGPGGRDLHHRYRCLKRTFGPNLENPVHTDIKGQLECVLRRTRTSHKPLLRTHSSAIYLNSHWPICSWKQRNEMMRYFYLFAVCKFVV